MPKINREEYEVLKGLDDRWKWIARDDENQIYSAEVHVFEKKPEREDGYWNNISKGGYELLREGGFLFQFIQWEDEEPYNIAELIGDYEYSAEHLSHVVNERVKALGKAWNKEEETEIKKDLKWFKEQLDDIEMNTPRLWSHDSIWMLDRVNELLNQLDEPEVLSQEFIDEHKRQEGEFFVEYEVVPVRDLQNLLVPKQEEMKVSKTWHDVIAQNKEEGHSLRWALNYIDNLNVNDVDDFAKAWLVYPNIEVEEEQKYRVIDDKGNYLLWKIHDGTVKVPRSEVSEFTVSGECIKLTEQEIKDYDEKYFSFAVPV